MKADDSGDKRSRFEALWLRADAWEELRRFWREILGLREVYVNAAEGWAQFNTDAGPALHVMRGGLSGQSPGAPVIGLRYPELENLHDRLTAAGIETEVRRGDPGITRLRFVDPAGHLVAAYRWELKDAVKPITVRGVAVDDAARILLVRVGQTWSLPGGVVDEAEGPLETLHREFLEEAGVRPVEPRLSGVYHTFPWDGLTLIFHCRVDGEPRPAAEVEVCEFVDVSRAAGLVNPWNFDRILDALEFPDRAVVRTQHTNVTYVPVRPRPPGG
jgi:8-oxo-dGTP diphosphatase